MAPPSPAHPRVGAPSMTDMTETDIEHDPRVGRWRDGRDVEAFERDADAHLPAPTAPDGVRDAEATPHDRVGDVRTNPAHR